MHQYKSFFLRTDFPFHRMNIFNPTYIDSHRIIFCSVEQQISSDFWESNKACWRLQSKIIPRTTVTTWSVAPSSPCKATTYITSWSKFFNKSIRPFFNKVGCINGQRSTIIACRRTQLSKYPHNFPFALKICHPGLVHPMKWKAEAKEYTKHHSSFSLCWYFILGRSDIESVLVVWSSCLWCLPGGTKQNLLPFLILANCWHWARYDDLKVLSTHSIFSRLMMVLSFWQ